jgi:hypothetical protein
MSSLDSMRPFTVHGSAMSCWPISMMRCAGPPTIYSRYAMPRRCRDTVPIISAGSCGTGRFATLAGHTRQEYGGRTYRADHSAPAELPT